MKIVLMINPNPTREVVTPEIDERIIKYHKTKESMGTEGGDQRHEPNNGLLSIGATLKKRGFIVEYLDLNAIEIKCFKQTRSYLTQEQIKEKVDERAKNIDFFLISALTPTINNAIFIAKQLKRINPKAKILLGGILPTLKPDYCIAKSNNFDAIVIGEGEVLTPKIIEAYLSNDFTELDEETGLIYRKDSKSNYIHKKGHNVIQDLNSIEDPAFELLEEVSKPFVYRVFTARGCSSACAFCAPSYVAGHRVRNVSPEKVINQIKKLKYDFNAHHYVLGDLTFLDNENHGRRVLELIKEHEINIPFWCQTRFDRINEENIKLLAEAGCTQIAIGIESYNDSILNMINKGINVNEMLKKLLLVKKYGIEVQAYFIVGLPNETKENIERTIKFAEYAVKKNFLDLTHISIYVPYPGLPAMKEAKIDDKNYNHYYQGVFEDMPPTPVYQTSRLTKEEIRELFLNLLDRVTYSYSNKEDIRAALKTNFNLENELLLGTEALTIAGEMEEYKTKGTGKKTVFNLVQGTRKNKRSFISKIIHEDKNYIIGDSEIYKLEEIAPIVNAIDGIVDNILLDADIKRPDSKEFIKIVYDKTKKSKIYTYSDMAIWCRAVFLLIQHEVEHLEGLKIKLFPKNDFCEYLAFLLKKRGTDVSYLNDITAKEEKNKQTVLVNFSFGEEVLGKEIIKEIGKNWTIIDATTEGIHPQVYEEIKNTEIRLLRPDMRPLLSSQLYLLENYNDYLEKSIGKFTKEGITFISGGLIGNKGDVVVDSIKNPTKVIGIADGNGSILNNFQLEKKDFAVLNKANRIISKSLN